MSRKGIPFFAAGSLILGLALLLSPTTAFAQHHGGGHGMGGGIPGASGRPSGVDEKDSLKDFHQAMALQATTQQVTEFHLMLKSTEAAQAALQALLDPAQKGNAATDPARREALDQAIEKARNGNKSFQEGFSAAQKSGLKDFVKRLAKTDADVEQENRKVDQSLDANAAGEVVTRAQSLDKVLTDFYNQELALGREMSITLASGQDVAFTLPPVKSPVRIENQTIAVTVSGSLSQVAVQGGQRTFNLASVSDLTDLQQNITALLRVQLDTAPTCGQRVAINRATLAPSTPASLLIVQLHYERWTCTRSFGQQTANELAEGDGTVEIKLSAAVDQSHSLSLTAVLGRIDATGMLGEALRSGSLGEDLRDKAAQTVLAAARAGSDFKATLPPAVQNSAVIQSARFQDTGVAGLSLVLDGRIEISNEQADQLAIQLNQALSAKETPPATPQLTKRPQ